MTVKSLVPCAGPFILFALQADSNSIEKLLEMHLSKTWWGIYSKDGTGVSVAGLGS